MQIYREEYPVYHEKKNKTKRFPMPKSPMITTTHPTPPHQLIHPNISSPIRKCKQYYVFPDSTLSPNPPMMREKLI
jgi:hypothetical protein